MSFAICRMQKMKAFDLKGIQIHNQREKESKTNLDIDKERSRENYDLIHGQHKINYNEQVKAIIESQKTGTRKTRKDAVLVNELLVTSDKDFFERLDPVDQKRFFKESFKLFSERYGKHNIAYAMVHVDEKTPHMHIGVVPMRDGKLQGKNVFNRKELLWIQDEFPKHMQKLGFDLERGEKGSTREHIESQIFKRDTLESEIDFLEKNLAEKKDEVSLLEQELINKKNSMLDMSKTIPKELKIQVKKEKKVTFEEKLVTIGKPKILEKETGNLIITRDEYAKMREIVHSAASIKSDYERLQQTDLVQENKELKQIAINTLKENKQLKHKNEYLQKEQMRLSWDNTLLKEHIGDLKAEIKLIYQSTKNLLKDLTSDLRTFKGVFNLLVDKIKEKNTETEFEKLAKVEKRRERNDELER